MAVTVCDVDEQERTDTTRRWQLDLAFIAMLARHALDDPTPESLRAALVGISTTCVIALADHT